MQKKQQIPCCICGELCDIDLLKNHEHNCLLKVQHRRITFFNKDQLPDDSLEEINPPHFNANELHVLKTNENVAASNNNLLNLKFNENIINQAKNAKCNCDNNCKYLQTKNLNTENILNFKSDPGKDCLLETDSAMLERIFKQKNPLETSSYIFGQEPCIINDMTNKEWKDKNVFILGKNLDWLMKAPVPSVTKCRPKTKKFDNGDKLPKILCDICGQSFNEEDMTNHYNVCLKSLSNKYNELSQKAKNNALPVKTNHAVPKSSNVRKAPRKKMSCKSRKKCIPELCFCYICGNQYTTASLPIHEKQCLAKWKSVNARLPRHLKRFPPRKPQILVKNMVDGLTKQEIMDIQWRASLAARIKCPYCLKSFSPFKIERHEAICRKVRRQNPFVLTENLEKLESKRNIFTRYSLSRSSNQIARSKGPKRLKLVPSKRDNPIAPRLTKSNQYLRVFFDSHSNGHNRTNRRSGTQHVVKFEDPPETNSVPESLQRKVIEWQMRSSPQDSDCEPSREMRQYSNNVGKGEDVDLSSHSQPWPEVFSKRTNAHENNFDNDENRKNEFSWNIFENSF